MAMDKETKTRMKALRKEMRERFKEKNQRMIQELMLEGMTEEDVAHEIRATRQSVNSWANGLCKPNEAHAKEVSRVHKQVTLLKKHGISYADIVNRKTLEQACDEIKTSVVAA